MYSYMRGRRGISRLIQQCNITVDSTDTITFLPILKIKLVWGGGRERGYIQYSPQKPAFFLAIGITIHTYTIVDSSNTNLNPIDIQALLRSVFDESTIITLTDLNWV